MVVFEVCVGMQGAGCWRGTGRNKWSLLGWCLKLRLSLLPGLHPYQHPSHHRCLQHAPLCQWVSGWALGADPCAPHGPPPPGYATQCHVVLLRLLRLLYLFGSIVSFVPVLFHCGVSVPFKSVVVSCFIVPTLFCSTFAVSFLSVLFNSALPYITLSNCNLLLPLRSVPLLVSPAVSIAVCMIPVESNLLAILLLVQQLLAV